MKVVHLETTNTSAVMLGRLRGFISISVNSHTKITLREKIGFEEERMEAKKAVRSWNQQLVSCSQIDVVTESYVSVSKCSGSLDKGNFNIYLHNSILCQGERKHTV